MGDDTNIAYQDQYTDETGSFYAPEIEEPVAHKNDPAASEQSTSHISLPSKSCHHCRVKKKLNCKVYNCVDENCKLAYCENCLNKHYNITEEKSLVKWICPKCRKICKCSHCKDKGDNRKRKQMESKEIALDDGTKKSFNESEVDSEDGHNGPPPKRKRTSPSKKDKGDEYEQLNSFMEQNRDPRKRPEDSLKNSFIKSVQESIKHNLELKENTVHILAMLDEMKVLENTFKRNKEIMLSTTTLRKTPLHVAAFYGSSNAIGYIIDNAKHKEWFQDLLQARDSANNTCYDIVASRVRSMLDPYFKKNKNGEQNEDGMDLKPYRLMTEDMSTQSTSTTVGTIYEEEKESQHRDTNVDHVILSNHAGNHKMAQKRRRPEYCGVEKVDRAKQKGEWKPATYNAFLNFLESDSLNKVQIYNRIGNETNWFQYCQGVNFSSKLNMGEVNYKEAVVGKEVNLYYYVIERKNEAKDWVEIAPSKECPDKLGLFSKTSFAPNITLCEYAGTLVPKGSKGVPLVYVRCMDFEIDSQFIGNESRFICSSPKANVHLMTVYSQDGPHVLVCTTNTIHPGDEIILDPKCL